MAENCTNDCSSCGEDCAQRTAPVDMMKQPHEFSHIKKVIGIVSGKGGVGKSLTTGLLASLMQKKGYQTAVLDADITGPSIPKMFGLTEKVKGNELGMYPAVSKNGTEVMSVNLLLPDETDPVVWRGPVIANAVQQFWTDVIWKEVDFMFVDMPPGTGDVPLTIFQSIPLDGIIVVTSPQELVSMIVGKAVKMANMMNIPILGVVENMSYYSCPDCGKEIRIFGDSHLEEITKEYDIPVLGCIPLDPAIARYVDNGDVESVQGSWLEKAVEKLQKLA